MVAMTFLSVEPLLKDIGCVNLAGIDWVIVGGESGVGARPLRPEWVLSIQKQCRRDGIPFFFKQWGGVQKSRAGRELNGRTFDEHPPINCCQVPGSAIRKALAAPFLDSWPASATDGTRRPA